VSLSARSSPIQRDWGNRWLREGTNSGTGKGWPRKSQGQWKAVGKTQGASLDLKEAIRLKHAGHSLRSIAKTLDASKSTIARDLSQKPL